MVRGRVQQRRSVDAPDLEGPQVGEHQRHLTGRVAAVVEARVVVAREGIGPGLHGQRAGVV